ncbi:MAG: M20 family metallopeptidase [Thermoplasmata archaeon]
MDNEILFKEEILNLSRNIYEYAELGSEEYKSSKLLVDSLIRHGFKVQYPYLGMKTAFRAEYGSGNPVVGILAEYDALPNGHSCGHNLIAAWAYGTAINMSNIIKKGKIVVFGTPAEEGRGEYAGSKAIMAKNGAFKDIDFVIGMHPDDGWRVGSKTLADITLEVLFTGKTAHMADSPQEGANALDAAVMTYVGINNLRSWIKIDKHAVIGMIFKEGGKATNVVPDRVVMEIDLRSSSSDFLKKLEEKVEKLIMNISSAYGVECKIKEITPLYDDYKSNRNINSLLQQSLKKLGIVAENLDLDNTLASGSSDEGNVSKVVPTGHIDVEVGYKNIAGHSDEFREAVNPSRAGENLLKGIFAAVDTISFIINDPSVLEKIIGEFNTSYRY